MGIVHFLGGFLCLLASRRSS